MASGVAGVDMKVVRETFKPLFEDDSFALNCPKMDDVIQRQLANHKHASSKYITQRENSWKSIQLKLFDLIKPLLALWSVLDPTSEAIVMLEAAIKIWADASFFVTNSRRSNVMSSFYPNYKNLLKDPSKFSQSEIAHLFGKSFTDSLLSAADEDARLQRMQAKPSRRTSTRQPKSNVAPSDAAPGTSSGVQTRTQSSSRYTLSSSIQTECVSLPVSPIEVSTRPCSDPIVGGRLARFASFWHRITKDPWVLDTVSRGLFIDFVSSPVQLVTPSEGSMTESMRAVCDQAVIEMLAKGAIVVAPSNTAGFVSRLFAVPKKLPGTWRPIVNLKPLNSFVRYEHFKMEGLATARHLLQRGDYLGKIDLKDAYFTIPVASVHQPFLRFRWRGVLYQFICVPFGLAPAPRVFTKILKPVVAFLRSQGLRLVIYLDDMLFLNQSEEGLRSDMDRAVSLLQSLGWLISWDKSHMTPSQVLEFLGLVIDSRSLSFALPPEKIARTRLLCQRALDKDRISLRDLASIMGMFSWAIPAVPFAQAHYRRVQQSLIAQLRWNGGDFDGFVRLTRSAREDLSWWVQNVEFVNGRTLFPSEPDIFIFSDASLSGWGASCCGVNTRGPWTAAQSSFHINELELLAALYALQSFTSKSYGVSVCLRLDNSTAVAYINKGGGTRSLSMTRISRLISNWCEERKLIVEAVYLPGVLNVIADAESRALPDSSDWALHPSTFKRLAALWCIDVDLFAAVWNRRLEKFYSWRPQPEAVGTDAFSVSWKDMHGYVFPPFGLIGRCISKVLRDQATVTMICPYWPSSPWFPLLLQLTTEPARILPRCPDLLTSATGAFHPLHESLLLVAWRLSGLDSPPKEFQARWSTFSWTDPVSPHTLLTRAHGEIGLIGAVGASRIPCLLL